MSIDFSQFFSLPYKRGLRISKAGGLRKIDQDISNYSVIKSIALTRGCSLLASSYFSWMNFSVA